MPDIGYLHSGFEKIGESLELQPIRHRHRSDELHLADGQQRGLARRGRAAAGDRTAAASPIYPRDHRRAVADQRPSAVQRRGRARHRGVHVFSLRLLSARGDLRHLRNAVRRPVHEQLYPRRRADVRHDAAGGREDSRVRPEFPQDARRHGAAAESQSDFHRPHQRGRRAHQRPRRSTAAPAGRSPEPAA